MFIFQFKETLKGSCTHFFEHQVILRPEFAVINIQTRIQIYKNSNDKPYSCTPLSSSFIATDTMGSSCSQSAHDDDDDSIDNTAKIVTDSNTPAAIISILKLQQQRLQQQHQQAQQPTTRQTATVVPTSMQGPDTLTMVDLATLAPKRAPAGAANPLATPSRASAANTPQTLPSDGNTISVAIPSVEVCAAAISPRANSHHHTFASSVADSHLESHYADLFGGSSLIPAGPRSTGETLSLVPGNHLWATDHVGFAERCGGSSSTIPLPFRGDRVHSTAGGAPEPSLDGFLADRTAGGSPTESSYTSEHKHHGHGQESGRSIASLKSHLRHSVAASSVWGSVSSDVGNGAVQAQALDLATFRTY